jgi:hypothetical protein
MARMNLEWAAVVPLTETSEHRGAPSSGSGSWVRVTAYTFTLVTDRYLHSGWPRKLTRRIHTEAFGVMCRALHGS